MNYLKSTLFITLIILGSSSLKPLWAQTFVGNLYTQIAPSTVNLTNLGDEISERFTMPNNLTSNNVTTLYINTEANTSNIIYSVGIQNDDGSVNHLPNGTWVVEATNVTLPNTWNTVAVTNTALTPGVIYHLVIKISATGTSSSTFTFWTPDNFLIPNGPIGPGSSGPVTDTELNYLTNPGGIVGGWTVGGGNSTFGLGFSDSSIYGAPYSGGNNNFIYGNAAGSVTQQVAQLFTFPTNIYFGTVGVYVQKSGTPLDSLRYYLVNTSSGATVVNGALGSIATDGINQWVTATFTAMTLSAGTTYRLILESNGSSSAADYDWFNYSTIPALNLATYGGSLSAQTSTDGGNTWTTVPDSDSSFELGLVATPTPTSTPTITPTNTPTNTPTFTPTDPPIPTSTPTPPYDASDLGKVVLAPVPASAGTNVCLYFDKPPVSCAWDVFNVLGQRVAALSFAQMQGNCWNTTGVPPGVYFVEIKITYQDGTTAQIVKKAVISQ